MYIKVIFRPLLAKFYHMSSFIFFIPHFIEDKLLFQLCYIIQTFYFRSLNQSEITTGIVHLLMTYS